MRIISGLFKGKKILQPKDSETRPLKDLTKESIFNIIRHSKKLHHSIAPLVNKTNIDKVYVIGKSVSLVFENFLPT